MRRASTWILTLLLLLVFAAPAQAENDVKVLMNGMITHFDTAITDNSRVLLPLPDAAHLFGLKVDQSAAGQKVTLTREGTTIVLLADAQTAQVNGKEIALDVPVRTVNGQTYVPLRSLAEATGSVVSWNQQDQLIKLTPLKSFLAELMAKDSQGDQKLTGDMSLKYAVSGAPGLTIDFGAKVQLDAQIYKQDSLTKLTLDVDGETTTLEEAVVGGKTYMRDDPESGWYPGPSSESQTLTTMDELFGGLNLAQIGQDLTKTAKLSLAGATNVDGARVVKVKLEFAPADLEAMINGLSTVLLGPGPMDTTETPLPAIKVDHYTINYWVNPDTMFLHRIELDMDATVSGMDSQDPMSMHMVMKGAFDATPLTAPIQFPADLPK